MFIQQRSAMDMAWITLGLWLGLELVLVWLWLGFDLGLPPL